MVEYVHIPEKQAYFKAQEDCCFWEVSYDPNNLGIVQRIDDDINDLNSWDFMCRCHPGVEMIRVSEAEFDEKHKEVCEKMTALGLKKC